MTLSIDAIESCTDILESMSTQEIQDTTQDDKHLKSLTTYIINYWPLIIAKVRQEIQPFWVFNDDLAEGRRMVVLTSLQWQALDQLHSNHMRRKKSISVQIHILVKYK